MGAHHGAMKRLVVGQQGLPAHASAKHEWPQNFFHGLREPRELRASAKERRHSQRTPVMARDAWMYWPRSGAVTTLPGWPFPIGQALPILFGSQRL